MLNSDAHAQFYYKQIAHGVEDPKHKLDVIVLHGIGSNENDLIPLMEQSQANGNFFFIRSLKQIGPNAYAMFPATFSANGPSHNEADARFAIDSLKKWIDAKKAEGILRKDAKLALLGFSQGAITSYALTLKYPDVVDLVIGLNGRVLPEYKGIHPHNKDKKIPVYAFYGLYDQIQPISFAHAAKEKLSKLSWIDLHYREGNGAHEVTKESILFMREAFHSLK